MERNTESMKTRKKIDQKVMRNMTVSKVEINDDDDGKAELKIYNVSQNMKRWATIEIKHDSYSSCDEVEKLKNTLITFLMDFIQKRDDKNLKLLKYDVCEWKTIQHNCICINLLVCLLGCKAALSGLD